MPKSPQQQEAANKYLKEKVDQIVIRVPKGQKTVIQDHAEGCGESLNSFIIRAIDNRIAQNNVEEGG